MKTYILVFVFALLALAARPVAASDQEQQGFVCDVCFFLAEWIETELASNATETWIINEVGKVCDILPNFLTGECKYLVQVYVPQIITRIQNRNPPSQICKSIGLCSALQTLMPGMDLSSYSCAQCVTLSNLLRTVVGNSNDPHIIKARISGACSRIGLSPMRHLCQKFLNSPKIMTMFVQRSPVNAICKASGDCPSLNSEQAKAFVQKYIHDHPFSPVISQSSTECQLCQWVFSAYESWLSDGQTQTDISLFLAQLCNFFGSYAAQCDQLVRVYVPKVIQSYVQKTPPPVICKSVGLCKFPNNLL